MKAASTPEEQGQAEQQDMKSTSRQSNNSRKAACPDTRLKFCLFDSLLSALVVSSSTSSFNIVSPGASSCGPWPRSAKQGQDSGKSSERRLKDQQREART